VPIGPDVSYATVLPYTCKPADVNAAFDLQERMVYHTMETYAFGTINPLTLRRWEQVGVDKLMLPGDDALLLAGVADFFGVNWYCTSVAKG
jgi:6-phospho-beta-glucosidase